MKHMGFLVICVVILKGAQALGLHVILEWVKLMKHMGFLVFCVVILKGAQALGVRKNASFFMTPLGLHVILE